MTRKKCSMQLSPPARRSEGAQGTTIPGVQEAYVSDTPFREKDVEIGIQNA